ncbi:hypothetical protein [Actinoplanes sichuanensis]|uniref:SMI1/KNR4 family protein n=1 Tax=Actinoplanes sichuanensis TaxID=512349 RepID=A0ABW4AWH5_9ACTN|nr:hypothetical protein [Actinoplanes sichuanensis]
MQDDHPATVRVRGLVVPDLLLDLLREGRWRHPGEPAVARVMPWFQDPLDFLGSIEQMERESRSLDHLTEDDEMAQLFGFARAQPATGPVELPWLDVDRAFFIAMARYAGDDTAIALDYRTSSSDPRVVASDVWNSSAPNTWRTVADTFSEFVAELRLDGADVGGP